MTRGRDHGRVVGRGELTDKAWARIEPLLPPFESDGRRWRDHHQVINAILWKIRTGARCGTCPNAMGPGNCLQAAADLDRGPLHEPSARDQECTKFYDLLITRPCLTAPHEPVRLAEYLVLVILLVDNTCPALASRISYRELPY